MDTKKLSALLKVVELGSLSSASAELGYTQPGLTNMMNSLESEFGIELLVRGKNGVHFTPAGQSLLPEISAVIKAVNSLEQHVSSVRSFSLSTLRVGAYSSVARNWLPSILASFKNDYPDTNLAFSVHDIQQSYSSVKSGDIDCAIVSYQKTLMNSLSWIPLKDDELVAIVPPVYDAPSDKVFSSSDFLDFDFLMPGGGFELDILPFFERSSKTPNINYANIDDATIVSLVERGFGASILSRLVLKGISGNVRVFPLEPHSSRTLGIIVKEKSKSKNESSINKFIMTAQKTIKTDDLF